MLQPFISSPCHSGTITQEVTLFSGGVGSGGNMCTYGSQKIIVRRLATILGHCSHHCNLSLYTVFHWQRPATISHSVWYLLPTHVLYVTVYGTSCLHMYCMSWCTVPPAYTCTACHDVWYMYLLPTHVLHVISHLF